MENNNSHIIHYMVVFDIETPFTSEMEALIPEQRMFFGDLFEAGKLLSYTVSTDRQKMWTILAVEAESELILLIDQFPMLYFLSYQYQEVFIHETLSMVPSMSLN